MGNVCNACREHPVTDTYTCGDCIHGYAGQLDTLPGLLADLHTERMRLTRKGAPSGYNPNRTNEQPLPFNPAAAAIVDAIRAALRCLHIITTNHHPASGADVLPVLAANHTAVGLHPDGGHYINHLARLMTQGRALTDNPPDQVFIGDCPKCHTRRLAAPDDAHHVCPCGHASAVTDAREALEDRCRAVRVTGAQVETITQGRIKASRVQKWHSRDQIHRDADGKVRFGDALSLEARMEKRTSRTG